MAEIKKLYPGGKTKAFILTYDDGVEEDIKFVGLIEKYNLKGCFNLNFGLMENQFEWKHPSGKTIKRLSLQTAVKLYKNHEIASHTMTHPNLENLKKNEILLEMCRDKENLELLFERKVRGFAIPFSFFSPLVKKCIKKSCFEYGRISEESFSLEPATDYFAWKPSIFHLNDKLENFVNSFLQTDRELAICTIAGHSYDLEVENKWGLLENIFKRINDNENILSMTMAENTDYLKEMRKCSVANEKITNNSPITLWFEIEGTIVSVPPFEGYTL